MRKKIFCMILTLVILFSYSLNAIASDNDTEQTIAESKKSFQQLDGKIQSLNSEMASMNVEIDKLTKKLDDNNKSILETEKQIEATETKMEQYRKEIESNQSVLDSRLRGMYKSGLDKNYLSILLGSSGLTDFLNKLSAIEKVVSLDKQLIDELNSKKEALKKTATDLNNKNENLKTLKKETEASLKTLNDKKQEEQALAAQFEKEKESLAAVIEANETKLISHSVSTIDSASPSEADIRNAISTLTSLSSQISTASVKAKAQKYIGLGKDKLSAILASATISRGQTSTNTSVQYKTSYTMSATAYTGGVFTALGLKPTHSSDGLSTIAVDPSVIPLGSKVFIPGYGTAIAADTGGAIVGNIVDLYFNSLDECNSWGRRNITLYIVAYPNEW